MENDAPKHKILYVITQGEWGGAQRYVFDLATNLPPEFEVTVAVGEPKGKRDLQNKLTMNNEQVTNKIKIVQLKYLVRKISPQNDIRAVRELIKLYTDFKPRIVHLNSSKASIVGSFAKMFIVNCSLLIVYTVHGWVFNESITWWRRHVYFWLEKITAHLKDAVIVLSQADYKQAQRLPIAPKKITLISHGIKMEGLFSPQAARAELMTYYSTKQKTNCATSRWVGTIANYYPTKGLDLLIEAIAQRPNDLRDTQFWLIGEGPERKHLTKLLVNYNLEDRIHLTGTIPQASRLLPAFDVFVLPSRKEGFPYVILETMAAGVPIISTSVGGIPEILEDKKSGLLLAPEDPTALRNALTFIFSHPIEAQKLRDNAQKRFNFFTFDTFLKQTTSLYYSLRERCS